MFLSRGEIKAPSHKLKCNDEPRLGGALFRSEPSTMHPLLKENQGGNTGPQACHMEFSLSF